MNFSDNYFSTLSYFNSVIEEELSKSKKVASIYHDVFIGKDSFKSLKPFDTRMSVIFNIKYSSVSCV